MNSSTKPLDNGTLRAFEKMDVHHHTFPISLFLIREALMDSVRHHARKIKVVYKELPNGDFAVKIIDDGDGKAKASRLIAPAEDNGVGTSRYGHGLRMLRLRNGGVKSPWSVAWKVNGNSFYHTLQLDPKEGYFPQARNVNADELWDSPDGHGFIFEMILCRDNLDTHDPSEIAPLLREICCISMTPEVLARIHVRIEVLDLNGSPLMEKFPQHKLKKDGTERKVKNRRAPRVVGIADSKEEGWISILDVLRTNKVGEYAAWDTTMTTGALARAEHYRLIPSNKKVPVHPYMPNYTSAKSQFALFVQDEFITDVALPEALGKAPHGASLNGRYVVVWADRPVNTIVLPNEDQLSAEDAFMQKEHIRQESIPTLAASKVTFVGPVYQELIQLVRTGKPAGWDKFEKKSKVDDAVSSSDDNDDVNDAPLPTVASDKNVPFANPHMPDDIWARVSSLEDVWDKYLALSDQDKDAFKRMLAEQ